MNENEIDETEVETEGEAAAETDVDADTEVKGEIEFESEAGVEGELELSADLENESVAQESESEGDLEVSSTEEVAAASETIEGTELEDFEAVSIEDVEVLTDEQVMSIVESAMFATDKPVSVAVIKQAFKGTNIRSKEIRAAIQRLQNEYFQTQRGFTLEEVAGGFQLRTKPENMKYLRQSVKARPFKLSGPALEVVSICAYKQPVTKSQIDEIRGIESGHLLRALMERGLISFGERSDLPGKPMFYETTRKFLEIFGLRNIQELPSLHEIDQLIPEGIGDEKKKETLSDLTGELSQATTGISYSEGEDELLKITDELSGITTSSEFFEEEKRRQRERRDLERAQDIREAMAMNEPVEEKDRRWLERYEAGILAAEKGAEEVDFVTSTDEAAPQEAAESGAESETHIEGIELAVVDEDLAAVEDSSENYRDEMKDMDSI